MPESLFPAINGWLTSGSAIAFAGSFAWGMVSVLFSPCHLASIPLIVAYVGGQAGAVRPTAAAIYSGAFSLGLFISIALVGVACTLLGRMLGDIGLYWQIPVGAVLIWVALGMLGVEACAVSGSLLYRLNFRGALGALGLGMAYGMLSGSCTFGFIAPILAVITIQKELTAGMLMILLFAFGHCLPIMAAGSSAAAVKIVLENRLWQGAGKWFRRAAGIFIGLLGVYFIVGPLVTAL